jgi:hypothetical protein
VIAKIWVIEFQKRGLPHTHFVHFRWSVEIAHRWGLQFDGISRDSGPNTPSWSVWDGHFVHGAWAMWSRFSQRTMYGAGKVQKKVPAFL